MDPYENAGAPAGTQPPANPYAAPSALVGDIAKEGALTKASRGARLGAVLLDSVPIAVAAIAAAIMLPATQRAGGGISPAGTGILIALALAAVAFAIYQLVQLHRTGQTWGKKLLGIRIVRKDGSRAGLGRIFWLRYFVPGLINNIPLVGAVFALVDPLFIFGEERRCVHDMIADTIVVDA